MGFRGFLAGSQLPRVYVGLWQQSAFRGTLSKMKADAPTQFPSLFSCVWKVFLGFRAGSQSLFWVPGIPCVSVGCWLAEKFVEAPFQGSDTQATEGNLANSQATL